MGESGEVRRGSGAGAPRAGAARTRRPWIRAGLASLVMLMLPFAWSEDMSCDGKPKPLVSGLEILFGNNGGEWQLGACFFGLFAVAVALAFVAHATRRLGWRLVCNVIAGLAGMSATALCAAMMTFGRAEQPLVHPAAWIGTLSAALMMIEAWEASGRTLSYVLARRRAAQRLREKPPPAVSMRIALAPEEKAITPDEAGDEEEAESESAARRARL